MADRDQAIAVDIDLALAYIGYLIVVLIEGNAVIGQAGGPTAVINQSLAGVIEGLKPFGAVKRILGMRHGVSGLIITRS